jgi:hypothetical protein
MCIKNEQLNFINLVLNLYLLFITYICYLFITINITLGIIFFFSKHQNKTCGVEKKKKQINIHYDNVSYFDQCCNHR